MKEGLVYVLKQPFILKSMLLAALLNLILTPLFVVGAPIIIRVTMESSDTLYGIGMGLIDFATILGALSIGFCEKATDENIVLLDAFNRFTSTTNGTISCTSYS